MGNVQNDVLTKMMAFNRQFMETNQPPELQEITEYVRVLTGAAFAAFNRFDDSGLDFTTEAMAGAPEKLMKVTQILGFNPVGRKWSHDPARHAAVEANNLTTFENLRALTGNVLPPKLVNLVEETFDIGHAVVIKITKQDKVMGDFTLLMPQGQSMSHPELAHLFASQVGLFLDRLKFQRDLEKERQRLADVIGATHAGAWEYNVQTEENTYNERWTEILGYTLLELQPTNVKSWMHLVHPEDYQRANLIFEDAIAKGIMYAVEFRMQHKEGYWVWVEDRGKVVSWTDEGKPLMMRGTRVDITERKMAEEKLLDFSQLLEQKNQELEIAVHQAQSANEAKSRYLAHMNHEIRTPLNGFMGFLQMMEDTRLDEEQQLFMRHMKQSTSHMLSIINNVLDMAKIEAGEMKLSNRVFKLEEEIDTALAPLRSLAQQKDITLKVDKDKNLPQQVKGDPDRFRQILLNLGGNAVKFTEEGQVQIAISCPETTDKQHRLQLIVEDSGPGMTQETMNKLFLPFYQADDGTTPQSKGTGLGMPITQELVELMDGEIQVESTLGKGTRVEVTVKILKANQ